MNYQQIEYAAEHRREMAALVLMVDAVRKGNQNEAQNWALQLGRASDAKVHLLSRGMCVLDAEAARVEAESDFEQKNRGMYQAARSFMYALKARMGR